MGDHDSLPPVAGYAENLEMKKIIFIFASIIALSFTSCGQRSQGPAIDNDSIPVETIDMLIDSLTNKADSTSITDSTTVNQ